MSRALMAIAVTCALLCLPVHAATVGYWRFDDGAPGTYASTLVSDFNSPALDGTAWPVNPPKPSFSANTPLHFMAGEPNEASLYFPNNAGVYVAYSTDHPLLRASTFTIEAFINTTMNMSSWPAVVEKVLPSSGDTWSLGFNSSGQIFSRFDTTGGGNQTFSGGPLLNDGKWHHVALTYAYNPVANNGIGTLFVDYVQVAQRTISGALIHNYGLDIGGGSGGHGPFIGLIDEVRFSDQVLTPFEFLRVPEPASVVLSALGGLAVLLWAGRRRQGSTARGRLRPEFLVMFLIGLIGSGIGIAQAEVVGYWRLNDGAPGTTATTAVSLYNNGVLQGTGGGATRVFSDDVPGIVIRDGLGGPVYTDYNTASLRTAGGGYIDIPFNALLEPTDLTIEFFMKAGSQGAYPGIVQKRKNPALGRGNITWGVGKNSAELEFARVDTTTYTNYTFTTPGSTADGQWHHFALTYESATDTWRLYKDYSTVTTVVNPPGVLDYDGSSGLRIGYAPTDFYYYNGLVDEVRFSNAVLTPDQFLRADMPEPSTAILAGLGGLVMLGCAARRRRRSSVP